MPSVIPTTPDRAGCWIDGHRGQKQSVLDLIIIATDYGWNGNQSKVVMEHLADYSSAKPSGAAIEYVTGQGGLIDRTVEWLNEHIAPDGYQFGWHCDDFMLQSDLWWAGRRVDAEEMDRMVGDIRDEHPRAV